MIMPIVLRHFAKREALAITLILLINRAMIQRLCKSLGLFATIERKKFVTRIEETIKKNHRFT